MNKVWFVTGSSRGLGREFVEAALSRGDRVAATARNTASLDDLVLPYLREQRSGHIIQLSGTLDTSTTEGCHCSGVTPH